MILNRSAMNKKNELFSTIISLLALLMFLIAGCTKKNVIINQSPTCEIVWPATNDEFVKGKFKVFVNVKAEDTDGEISKVIYYIDDVEIDQLTDPPYEYLWDTKDTEGGNREIKATAVDMNGKSFSDSIVVIILVEDIKPCPGMDSVIYGGQTYHTILIGSQCWFKENLNIGTPIHPLNNQQDNGIIEKYCAGGDTVYCKKYGGLYQWGEVMAYDTTSGSRGICPEGWHIPDDEEWKLLQGTVDSKYGYPNSVWNGHSWSGQDVGKRLKSWESWSHNGHGIDLYGFKAIPAAIRTSSGIVGGYHTYFWTSTISAIEEDKAAYRRLVDESDGIYRNYADKKYGFSVRCLRDY